MGNITDVIGAEQEVNVDKLSDVGSERAVLAGLIRSTALMVILQ